MVLLQSDARSDAGDKIALVIGNSDYAFSPLVNPTNDAADMGAALEALGFEVTVLLNADQRAMKRAIDEFGRKLDRDRGTGLFYFAGHGVQVRGRNYLIPVNARIRTENDVEYESVDAGRVLAKMEDAGNELNIVILDACRNNPFARSFRSARNGLASIDAPSGSLIAYATAPGSVAADGSGRNGLYTANLLRAMQVPGLGLEQVFKRVRVAVREATDGLQTPWENTSLEGDFYFIPLERRVATQQPAPRQPAPVVSTPVDRQPQSEKATATAQPPAPDGGTDGRTLVNVTSNGTLARARIEVYKSGTEQRVLLHDTSSTDPARNPARLELATGDYDVRIAPLEINGSEPREISNLRVSPGAPSTLDVEFPYGVLKFSGLVNGALGLTRLEVFHAGARQQVLWLDTSDTDKNRNPLQIKLAPGDYDVKVTAMRVLGAEPRLLQNVTISAGETRSLKEVFEEGTLSVLATANGKLINCRVEIFEAGTGIQVSWGDTSDRDKKRNPLPFRLAPNHYDIQVSALNLAGSEPILIEGVRLDARAEETLTAAF